LYLIQHDHSTLPFPYQITHLWSTLDDAAGEAFDKVSRMLGWPYPWGPRVSAHASQWSANPLFVFKTILLPDQALQFSFSGIKSNIHHLLAKKTQSWQMLTDQELNDICRAFEQTIGHTLAHKLNHAVQQYESKTVAFVGWVSANDTISAMIQTKLPSPLQLYRPTQKIYSTDNGAMIGVVGLMNWLNTRN
jgi:N6-L-threonylcarbamoyladenine synthase